MGKILRQKTSDKTAVYQRYGTQSKTGLCRLKNKETQQVAGMNQAKNGLVETDSKLNLLKVGHNWTTQNPILDYACLHEFVATIGHKSNPAKSGRKLLF